jgi:3-phenylpropionate/trans-cinnamate dioxygenase ferredoxin component
MSDWVDVGAVGDMADGTMKAVTAGGRELLVVKSDQTYYASDEKCPHMGGSLAHGTLSGTVIQCPRHGSRFDLTDGRIIQWTAWSGTKLSLAKMVRAPRPLKTYPVRVENGRVLVELG